MSFCLFVYDYMKNLTYYIFNKFPLIKAMGSVDTKKYPFIEAWFLRCKQHIPNYEVVCGQGAQSFGDLYKKAKAANIRRENESPYRRHSIYIRTVSS